MWPELVGIPARVVSPDYVCEPPPPWPPSPRMRLTRTGATSTQLIRLKTNNKNNNFFLVRRRAPNITRSNQTPRARRHLFVPVASCARCSPLWLKIPATRTKWPGHGKRPAPRPAATGAKMSALLRRRGKKRGSKNEMKRE